MTPKRNRFFAGILAASALAVAPLANADHYHDEDYGGYCHHDRGRHPGHSGHWHHAGPEEIIVVNNHYHRAPVRRIVEYRERVVERPVIVRERYHSRPARYAHGHEYRSATPVILGGILGGVVGNRMGKGRGRDIATVAGVLLGGSIGRDLAHDY